MELKDIPWKLLPARWRKWIIVVSVAVPLMVAAGGAFGSYVERQTSGAVRAQQVDDSITLVKDKADGLAADLAKLKLDRERAVSENRKWQMKIEGELGEIKGMVRVLVSGR